MELKTEDHPEANGRSPQCGDIEWACTFPLENGEKLILRMGQKGLENLRHIVLDQMIDERTDPNYNKGLNI